jgi:hypothetical protein
MSRRYQRAHAWQWRARRRNDAVWSIFSRIATAAPSHAYVRAAKRSGSRSDRVASARNGHACVKNKGKDKDAVPEYLRRINLPWAGSETCVAFAVQAKRKYMRDGTH